LTGGDIHIEKQPLSIEELSTALKEGEDHYNSDTYNVKTREPRFVVTYHDDTYVAGYSH
jgi:hypothetical protein